MALNDDATLVLNAGNYFLAPEGTAMPADLMSIATPWSNLGHTKLDEVMGLTADGGDATVLGTLQNKTLRTSYAPRQETFAITVQQFDAATLKLYFGSNMIVLPDGSLGVPSNPTPTISAFLAVFTDGDTVFAFYAPSTEIIRGDDPDISDTESLAGLPLAISPKQYQSNKWPYAVTPLAAVPAAG